MRLGEAGPQFGIFVELESLVNLKTTLHLHYSEFDVDSHVVVVSKESEDLNKPRGVKTLLSVLLAEVSVLANVLRWRK